MDFEPTDRCKEILEQVRDFMAEHVYPVEDEVIEAIDREVDVDTPSRPSWSTCGPREGRRAVEPLPAAAALDDSPGLTNEEYGTICEEGAQHAVPLGVQLPAARQREHGDPRRARHSAPARTLARAAARGRDPQLLLDDRARRRGSAPHGPLVPRRSGSGTSGSSTAASGGPATRWGRQVADRDGGHRPGRPPAHQLATMLLVPTDTPKKKGLAAEKAWATARGRGTGRSPTRTAASRSTRPRSARARAASRSPRTGSAGGGSITACG